MGKRAFFEFHALDRKLKVENEVAFTFNEWGAWASFLFENNALSL